MASPVTKQVRRLVVVAVVIAAMWGLIAWKGYEPNLGLDLQGGVSVVLCPKGAAEGECGTADEGTLDQTIEIIRNRVDGLGVAEPDISRQGENILVQLPGVAQSEALEIIGRTALLRFRPVEDVATGPEAEKVECGVPETYPEDDPTKPVIYCEKSTQATAAQALKLTLGPAALEGKDIANASAQLDPQGAIGWFVSLDLTGDGSKKFEDITGKLACNRGQGFKDQLAIVLDQQIETHPSMGQEVQCNNGIGGTAQITGQFTEDEAKELALVLRYGALPVELIPTTATAVSPTLGKEALRGGLTAGVIGLALVFLYVLAFYRGLGLVVWAGITVHGAVTLGVVYLLGQPPIGFALSLAGIAGLIMSLGVASDSFIVYFERIKDEIHQGKTARASVDRAWKSARRTIIAADLVTALAATVLYFLAVGSVRGFALMLGLATALDLIVSFWFMHPVVWLLAQTSRFSEGRFLGLKRVAGMAGTPAPVQGGGS